MNNKGMCFNSLLRHNIEEKPEPCHVMAAPLSKTPPHSIETSMKQRHNSMAACLESLEKKW